jgi:effector-binding domain-containing protein
MNAIGATLGRLFGQVHGWAAAHGVALAGPAVARYVSMSEGACEIDAGFICEPVAGGADGDVRVVDLGGGTAACATHLGPYETLPRTYADVERWMGANGYVPAGAMWEEYFSPPGTPPDETRTDLCWPVRKA